MIIIDRLLNENSLNKNMNRHVVIVKFKAVTTKSSNTFASTSTSLKHQFHRENLVKYCTSVPFNIVSHWQIAV